MAKNILIFIVGFILIIALLITVAVVSSHFGVGNDGQQAVFAEHEEAAPVAVEPDIKGFLSRVEYNNHVAYLFGSMHAGRGNWFPLNQIVEDAMARSDVFAFETDLQFLALLDDDFYYSDFWDYYFLDELLYEYLDEFLDYLYEYFDYMVEYFAESFLEMFELFLVLEERASLPPGRTLGSVLRPYDFINLIAVLETFPNVTYLDIGLLTPSLALATIMEKEMPASIYLADEHSVDFYVMNFALARSRQVIGLNDILSEIYLLFSTPIDVQAGLFEDFPYWETFYAETIRFINDMVEAYETNDAERLRYLAFDTPENYLRSIAAQHDHETFVYRTSIYANEVLRLLRETEEPTTFFITVGAGHILYGHFSGVLEASGLEITELWR